MGDSERLRPLRHGRALEQNQWGESRAGGNHAKRGLLCICHATFSAVKFYAKTAGKL